jgi:hypothetical protein
VPVVDVTTLTEDELAELHVAVVNERNHRRFLATAEQTAANFNRQFLDASGITPGAAWTQPAGAHDAYPLGWVTLHNGKEWESLLAFNVWEPGVSGWREIVPEGEPPAAWVQPAGAHDAYPLGAQVTHNGFVWTSLVDANVWEPSDAVPSLWEKGDPA